jgi:tetratricopeptide (TPR) repeat protein
MKFIRSVVMLLALLNPVFLGAAQTSKVQPDEISIYAFAENLFSEKDYYRAITEYKRLSFLYPQSGLIPQVKFRIAKSYQLGEKFQIAFDLFDSVTKEYPTLDVGQASEFESVETLYRMGNYDLALAGYEKFIKDNKYANLKDRAIYKQGYAHLRLRDTEKARQSFGMVAQNSLFAGAANDMSSKTNEFEKIPRKKPFLAGIMSAVIPGTGQFYNGRVKDGIIALITNGLFIWGTYEAFHREYYSIGAVAGTFALGWYSGNIFSAVNGSFRYNHNKEEKFLEDLRPNYEFLGEK